MTIAVIIVIIIIAVVTTIIFFLVAVYYCYLYLDSQQLDCAFAVVVVVVLVVINCCCPHVIYQKNGLILDSIRTSASKNRRRRIFCWKPRKTKRQNNTPPFSRLNSYLPAVQLLPREIGRIVGLHKLELVIGFFSSIPVDCRANGIALALR